VADVTIKGFIIARLLDMVKEQLSEEEFKALQDEVGIDYKSLKLSFFRDYPVDLQLAVEARIAKILWNRTDDGAFYEFGRYNFQSFSQSTIGRATLAMLGKDPKKMVKASIRLMSTVMGGIVIEVEDRGETEISFRFRNNPYRPLGWQGVIDAALQHAGVTPQVQIIEHGRQDTEYLVSWS